MSDGSVGLLARPAPEGARLLCLRFLQEAVAAAPRLNDLADTEALHDFRVGLRRLRSCMRAYRPFIKETVKKRLHRRVGEVARATGEGRDTEVQMAWLRSRTGGIEPSERVGARWLAQRLEERLNVAYAHTRSSLLPDFEALARQLRRGFSSFDLRVDLEERALGPTFAQATAALVREQLADLQTRLVAIDAASDKEHVHEARIAAKRLRYLLEPLREEVPGAVEVVDRLKSLQDLLGHLHDGHVMAAELATAGELAAAERHRRLHELAVNASGAKKGTRKQQGRRDERPGLLALARGVRADRERLYEQYLVEWSDAPAEAFFSVVQELAEHLERPPPSRPRDVEIERKYLLRGVPPEVSGAPWVEIAQGWLPGTRILERVRRSTSDSGVTYERAIKLGSGVKRIEVEEELSLELWKKLWPLTKGKRIEKRRYAVRDGELTWEIDVFKGRELVLAEVELAHEDARVALPAWLEPFVEREVTDDAAYVNANLAS